MEEQPNCKQLKTAGLQFLPCLGHSMSPQHPWHGRIQNQGSWRKQTSSVHQASLLCQQHPQYRHIQTTALLSPGTSPKSQIQGFPKLGTISMFSQSQSVHHGAGQCKCYLEGPFHLPSNNCKFCFKFVTFAGTEIFSTDLKPSVLGNYISKDYYGNSSSSLIKIILHLVSSQKLLMNIRERMRKIII